jgi:transposase InsO family protein
MVSSSNIQIFLKLNNYDYSRENLAHVAEFLRTGVVPDAIADPRQRRTFEKRYGSGEFELKPRSRVATIIYKPLNLELVCKDDIEKKLTPLYKDPKIGTGMGIRTFYGKVVQKYIGINRDEVRDFIQKQTPYQLTKAPPRPVNKPIIGNYPNHRWEADLIDMAQYSGYNKRKKYILTVIDVFSRYVFAVGLPNKKPLTIIAAFRNIKKRSKVFPVILQTDWGTEFRGELEEFAAHNDMKIVHSLTHTPQTNGLVENFNLYLRKMIREGFVRNNNLVWITHLDDYTYNRNHTRHGRLHHTPVEMWSPTRTPIEEESDDEDDDDAAANLAAPDAPLTQPEIQRRVLKKTLEHTEKTLARFDDQKFEVDDKVCIKLAAIDTRVRAEIKAGNGKLLPVRYTPEVYRVMSVYQSRTNLAKPQYVTTYSSKRFFGSDLQKVDDGAENSRVNVDKLNKI